MPSVVPRDRKRYEQAIATAVSCGAALAIMATRVVVMAS